MDKKKDIFYLLIIFLIAFGLRSLSYGRVFGESSLHFLDPDSYYHMRGIIYIVQHFPNYLLFDSYIYYPSGFPLIWSPLFDMLVAFFAILAGLGDPSVSRIEEVAAFFPAIIGALTVIPVYFLIKNIFNKYAGFIGAFLLAIMVAHIYKTLLGYADHQSLNMFLSILIYTFFILALIEGRRCSDKYRLFSIIAGIISGIALFGWAGAPIYMSLIGIFALLQSIIDQRKRVSSNYLVNSGIITFLIALLTASMLQIAVFGNLERILLQLILTSAFLFEFILISLISKIIEKKKMNWKVYTLTFVGIILFIAALVVSIYPKIISGIFYVTKESNCILLTIQETQSLFEIGETMLIAPWNLFHLTLYTALLGLGLLIYKKCRDSEMGLFVIIWFIYSVILAYYQARFSVEMTFPIIALNGYLISNIKSYIDKIPLKERGILTSDNLRRILPGAIILLIIAPGLLALTLIKDNPNLNDPIDYYDTWQWMKENTPKTDYYSNPAQQPEYGVMNFWSYGNGIIYYAQRPVIANNFQIGIVESSKFFTETDEQVANKLLDKFNSRYIFSTPLNPYTYRDMLMVAEGCTRNESFYRIIPFKIYFNSMLIRLHLDDGREITKRNVTNLPLEHYRLVYESKNLELMEDYAVSRAKVFEYVKGALIAGKAPPGNISMKVKIGTNKGRIFWYNRTIISNGTFNLIVPYSIDSPYKTRAIAPYIFSLNNLNKTVYISEKDINQGNMIELNFIEANES